MNSNFGINGRVIAMKSMVFGFIKVASSQKIKWHPQRPVGNDYFSTSHQGFAFFNG